MIVVDHETLCRNPSEAFGALAARVGVPWTPQGDAAVAASNRPGRGWSTNRVTAEVPGQWRTRLDLEQQQTARRVLAPFPIAGDYAELA